MKNFKYLAFITAALLSVLSFGSTANASQEEFESLIYAIENDDFEQFQKLLQSGANPNFIGEEMGSPIRWVNCSAARFRPLKWIKTLEEHGAYMSHLRILRPTQVMQNMRQPCSAPFEIKIWMLLSI